MARVWIDDRGGRVRGAVNNRDTAGNPERQVAIIRDVNLVRSFVHGDGQRPHSDLYGHSGMGCAINDGDDTGLFRCARCHIDFVGRLVDCDGVGTAT